MHQGVPVTPHGGRGDFGSIRASPSGQIYQSWIHWCLAGRYWNVVWVWTGKSGKTLGREVHAPTSWIWITSRSWKWPILMHKVEKGTERICGWPEKWDRAEPLEPRMVSCLLERDQGCVVSPSHPWVWLVSHPCWGSSWSDEGLYSDTAEEG